MLEPFGWGGLDVIDAVILINKQVTRHGTLAVALVLMLRLSSDVVSSLTNGNLWLVCKAPRAYERSVKQGRRQHKDVKRMFARRDQAMSADSSNSESGSGSITITASRMACPTFSWTESFPI
jgi:hypothetical protein